MGNVRPNSLALASRRFTGFVAAFAIAAATSAVYADVVSLSSLDLSNVTQDWGKPQADRSVDGNPLSIGEKSFARGLGTHATSSLFLKLDGRATRFTAQVGVDDEVKPDRGAAERPIEFRIYADGITVYKSGPMRVGDPARPVDLNVSGVKSVVLSTRHAARDNMYAHADWADATITYDGAKPETTRPPDEAAVVLTPKPAPTPRINGTTVFGVRPGSPVIYRLAATGDRPMRFEATHLPDGLSLDAATGIVTGSVKKAGTYDVQVAAANTHGRATRTLRFVVGDGAMALTPPMGWNSWNCFADDVSDAKVRAAVDVFVSSGLVDHGWSYVNIDDCWQIREKEPADKRRDANGRIRTNAKFPDMKALTDFIHAKGLRAGIYSSPGPATCAGFEGSYKFEAADAKQYAEWGFDYLKYDWCAYNRIADGIRRQPDRPSEARVLQDPYLLMHSELKKQDRDIVYSLCQYGMGDVWQWGERVGGHLWRTTGDIEDTWGSMSGIGFGQAGHEAYAGPGHWNDPDMLVVGQVGWGPKLHPTRLTPNEQYTHVSLWSLLASPLLIGCDLTKLDDFTRGLLTNDEVIAVNQDPLGKQARRVLTTDDDTEIWAKPLADGTTAIGLFNRSEIARPVGVTWSQLGLNGPQTARDLWRQKDLGDLADSYTTDVPRHGVVMLKLTAASKAK